MIAEYAPPPEQPRPGSEPALSDHAPTMRVSDWREQYRGAWVDAHGVEIPITERMIRRALAEAEPLKRSRSPVPTR